MNARGYALNRTIAILRGTRFEQIEVNAQSGEVLLMLIETEETPDLTGLKHEWKNGKLLVHSSKADLEQRYRDAMRFFWRGKRFSVQHVEGPQLHAYYSDNDQAWPTKHGLDGNRYDGFTGTFPLDEVDDLHIERKDLITRTTTKIEL